MTHAELRTLVAGYAAGTLEGPAAETVRVHLASGCSDCLGDLYARPVGLPRAARPRARLPWRALAVVGALALAAVAASAAYDLRRRVAAARGEATVLATRLAAIEGERATLAARLAAQEAARESVRAALDRSEAALAAGAEEREALARQLAIAEARVASLARGVRRRDAEVQRLLARADVAEDVRALAARPGLQLLALAPVAPFREPSGHVLWRPGGDTLALFAFGLPRLPPGTGYALRVASDGRPPAAQPLAPGPDGAAALVVHLAGGVRGVLDVEVVREPPADAVLAGRAAAGG
ncbi:MAG TPA: hypothetical protein VKW76_12055 [Candidatus Binatia bacterium]|nr:hypothetical protein [Candidatus Binatia bacterium]